MEETNYTAEDSVRDLDSRFRGRGEGDCGGGEWGRGGRGENVEQTNENPGEVVLEDRYSNVLETFETVESSSRSERALDSQLTTLEVTSSIIAQDGLAWYPQS